jgi:hypothetical protein
MWLDRPARMMKLRGRRARLWASLLPREEIAEFRVVYRPSYREPKLTT